MTDEQKAALDLAVLNLKTHGDDQLLSAVRPLIEFYESRVLAERKEPKLAVVYGSMPESNGKSNWTAILHNGDISRGITLDRSEYPDRVRYEADRARWLIGELDEEPFILDYDADKHSGYVSAHPKPDDAFVRGLKVAREFALYEATHGPNGHALSSIDAAIDAAMQADKETK